MGKVSYAQFTSGAVEVSGKKVKTASLADGVNDRALAKILKKNISKGRFLINKAALMSPGGRS